MKKILFLITKAETGGAQKYVSDMAYAAYHEGFDVTVASEKNGYLRESLKESNIAFYEIKHSEREIHFLKDVKLFWELFRLIRKEKPDIVHLNSSKIGAMGAIAGKIAGVPRIIFTAHGWAFNDPRPQWQKIVIKFISRFAARFQDAIICVSKYDKKRALELKIAPEKKLAVVHNGINLSAFKPLARASARARLALGEKDFVVGTIANFYKTKSLDTLVLTAISARAAHAKFVIIGEGPEKQKIENIIAKYKLENRFILIGALPSAAMYLKAFDIFALPSKKEGLPYALLEAMAAKLPCVAGAVGGIPEIIRDGENGVLIPHLTPGTLGDAIAGLAKNKKRARELGIAAQKTIAKHFSLEEMTRKTIALYHAPAN